MSEEEKQTQLDDDFSDEDEIDASDFHNFSDTPVFIGMLKSIEDEEKGKSLLFEDGTKVGYSTVLQSRIDEEDVGKKIKIQFDGEGKSKEGRVYFQFRVWKK